MELCSFCRRPRSEVGTLIAGPGVAICDACVDLCVRLLGGASSLELPSWGPTDPAELLARLGAIARASDDAERYLREQVASLRKGGVSWPQIGSALGVSKQAVWERFGGAEAVEKRR